jgi:hypothetical protein
MVREQPHGQVFAMVGKDVGEVVFYIPAVDVDVVVVAVFVFGDVVGFVLVVD